MSGAQKSWINQLIHRHKRLGIIKDWLTGHWLMVVIFFLFVAIVLCMINLIVMVLTT